MNEEPKKNEKSVLTKIGEFLLKALKFPFLLIMNLARLINEIRVFVISLITIIVVIVVLFILLVIFKPEPIWSNYKDFMNADLVLPQMRVIKQEDIYNLINREKNDEFSITLDEDQVTHLFRQSGVINASSRVSINDKGFVFYLNTDTEEKPLWLIIKTERQDNGELKIKEVGFARMGLPSFIASGLDSTINSLLGVLAKQNGKDGGVVMINQILETKAITNDALLDKVEFGNGEVKLTFKID